MNKEEKELLIKVLCAGLSHKLKVRTAVRIIPIDTDILGAIISGKNTYKILPYLRPMSSMTEEEKQESRWYRQDIISDNFMLYMNRYVEWLDSKHFDWRTDGNDKTMIEIGLALEAPEGLYND